MSEMQNLSRMKTGRDVKLALKIEYDTEPVSIINNAKLLDHHIFVKIKKNTTLYHTCGKAFLIDQLDYDEENIGSYVLQYTKEKKWVVYEVIHDKKTELLSLFKQERRSNREMKLVQYPLYATLILLAITEIYMIVKMVVLHEMIFITNPMLRQIILFLVAYLILIIFLEYHIRTAKAYVATLSVPPQRPTTYEEINFYLDGQMLVSGTVPVFTGKLWHEDMPDTAIGLYLKSEEYDQTLDHFRAELKILASKRKTFLEKILNLVGEKQKLDNELMRRESEKILADPDIKEALEFEFKELKKKKEKEKNHLESEIARYSEEAKAVTQQIAQLGKESLVLLRNNFNFEDKLKNDELEAILFPTQKVEALRHKNANAETVAATFERALRGSKNISNQISQTINERVAQDVSTLKTSPFQMAYVTDEEGNVVNSLEESKPRKKAPFLKRFRGVDMTGLIFALIALIVIISVGFKAIDMIIELVNSYQTASTSEMILSSVMILAILGGIVFMFNWLRGFIKFDTGRIEMR